MLDIGAPRVKSGFRRAGAGAAYMVHSGVAVAIGKVAPAKSTKGPRLQDPN